ncbi:hypothetical protein [Caballeronia sordidicola]|uniref:Uncharacterized protein n=1 Tax=Caballeronia sordidicola TaxID=196367 RepID=A0A242MXK1_CABSO|nr:hypothetical protein [Caballeronia sordidicola]OTP75616.1 hypothetical protein PAMC26577_13085 [Caballeronia sordidicola]
MFDFDAAIGLIAAGDWAAHIGEMAASIEAVVRPVINVTCNLFQSGTVGAVAFDVIGTRSGLCLIFRSGGYRELPTPERVRTGEHLDCSVVDQIDGLCISACLIRQFGAGVAVKFF